MKFKQFVKWCNERACDGCWGLREATICIGIHNEICKFPLWKRNKIWKDKYEAEVLEKIVKPINDKISRAEEIMFMT